MFGMSFPQWLFSLALHSCLLAALSLWGSGAERTPTPVYRVSLAGFGQSNGQRHEALPGASSLAAPAAVPIASPPHASPAPVAPSVAAVKNTSPQKKLRSSAQNLPNGRSEGRQRQKRSPVSAASVAPSAVAPRAASAPAGSAGESLGAGAGTASDGFQSAGSAFTAGQVDNMPSITKGAKPVYPPAARRQGIEGRVMVRFIVDSGGLPVQASVHSAEPQGYFEEAALQAVSKMRFLPGKKAGRPVSTVVVLPLHFKLR